MIKKVIGFMVAVFLFMSVNAAPAPEAVQKTIVDSLRAARPDLNYGAVETSPIDGLYIVRINGTQFIYSNATGDYIISGDMYKARPGLFMPVKDLAVAEIRKSMMDGVAKEDSIVFPAVNETRAVLYVFTDVDCGYCRKLHNETLPDLSAGGVEVRYLAYPRAGIGSSSYRKVASAWCAKDKQKALSTLKNREEIPENVCKDDPVAAQYALGQKMGVTGTPALILEDGTLLPGYRPASELLKMMGLN